MSQLEKNFQYGGNQIRTIMKENEVWFVAKDVCDVLDLSDTSKALARLDEDEKGKNSIRTLGGNQELLSVNESGLYSLILGSRKAEARAFKKWITSEVLPSIRKHGGYLTPEKTEELIANPDLIIQLATALKTEREEKASLVAALDEALPKAGFFDQVAECKGTHDIKTAAGMLNFYGMGEKNLFRFLRDAGIFQGNNCPYREQIELGRFEVKMKKFERLKYGESIVETYPQTRVTAKGLEYIRRRLEEAGDKPIQNKGA